MFAESKQHGILSTDTHPPKGCNTEQSEGCSRKKQRQTTEKFTFQDFKFGCNKLHNSKADKTFTDFISHIEVALHKGIVKPIKITSSQIIKRSA